MSLNTQRGNNLFTVADVAQVAGCTKSRVRQICIEHGIGHKAGRKATSARVFDDDDVDRLSEVMRQPLADMLSLDLPVG